jgi:hypothetical protein
MDTIPEPDQQSTLSGKVTDPDGTIQPGLPVSLHQANPSRLVAQTTVNAAGRYEFGDLAPGVYTLRVAPGTEQASERRDIDIDGGGDVEQNVTVPQATSLRYRVTGKRLLTPAETGNGNHILGQVLDADGQPLDDVTVRMSWTGAAPDMKFPTVQSLLRICPHPRRLQRGSGGPGPRERVGRQSDHRGYAPASSAH